MISISIAEGATLLNTTGAYWRFAPTGMERVRLVANGTDGLSLGYFVDFSAVTTCNFYTSRGKFITSGKLATQPALKPGESLLIEIENHGGNTIEVQWW